MTGLKQLLLVLLILQRWFLERMRAQKHATHVRRLRFKRKLQQMEEEADEEDWERLSCFVMAVAASQVLDLEPEVQWWVKPRSTIWYDTFVQQVYGDHRWKRLFGMTKATFNRLVQVLHPRLVRMDTHYRQAVPVRIRLASAIYRLRNGCKLISISEEFGIGESTALRATRETCRAIIEELVGYISFPVAGADVAQTIRGFEDLTTLPNVIGSIDCTHFRISKPVINPEAYFKHHQHSIVMQAIVDSRKRFLDIYCGWPGSVHDSRVWRNSGFLQRVLAREVMQAPVFHFQGYEHPPYLLGDKGYSCTTTVMTPFRQNQLQNRAQRHFNQELSAARGVVECTFGLLKNKFQILQGKMKTSPEAATDIIFACCILHNYLIDIGDANIDEELLELEDLQVEEDDEALVAGEVDGEEMRERLVSLLAFR